MNLLATLYSPSLNPVGSESLTALAVAAAFAIATSNVNPSQALRLTSMRIGPLVLLVMSLFEEGSVTFSLWPVSRVLPSASDYVAGNVCYAFGFVISVGLLKKGDNGDKLLGMVLSGLHGGLVLGSAARLRAIFSEGHDYAWIATLAFAACWCIGVVLYRTSQEGVPHTTGKVPISAGGG